MSGESRIGKYGTEYDSEPQELTESSVRHLVAPSINISPAPPAYLTNVAAMLKTVSDKQEEDYSFHGSPRNIDEAGGF
jgi:hypothetical protein